MENNELILQKEKEYTNYIIEHVSNVTKAVIDIIKKCSSLDYVVNNKEELIHRAEIHDESKYSDEEFYAYRKYFYPIDDKEKEESEEEFELAWKHHYTFNTHHWDHWYNPETKVPQDMPILDILEMCADWIAMGYKFNNKATDWYEKEKDNIFITNNTRDKVLEILDTFYK